MPDIAPLSLLSSVVVLDTSLDGWSLLDLSMEGDRFYRYGVSFSQAFSAPPVIHIGVVGLDVSKDDNTRFRVRALDITEAGFTLQAQTWWNTRIWSVEISWLAIGM
jgi:hypothetical protein